MRQLKLFGIALLLGALAGYRLATANYSSFMEGPIYAILGPFLLVLVARRQEIWLGLVFELAMSTVAMLFFWRLAPSHKLQIDWEVAAKYLSGYFGIGGLLSLLITIPATLLRRLRAIEHGGS